jgi:CHASE3 domain sensor protein
MTELTFTQRLRVKAASGLPVVISAADLRIIADGIDAAENALDAIRDTRAKMNEVREREIQTYEKALKHLSEAIVHNLVAVGLVALAVLWVAL